MQGSGGAAFALYIVSSATICNCRWRVSPATRFVFRTVAAVLSDKGECNCNHADYSQSSGHHWRSY
jgi:hypothetical protein